MFAIIWMIAFLHNPVSTSTDLKGIVLNEVLLQEVVSFFIEVEETNCRSLAKDVADMSKKLEEQSIKMNDMASIMAKQSDDMKGLKHRLNVVEDESKSLRRMINDENRVNSTMNQNKIPSMIERNFIPGDSDDLHTKSKLNEDLDIERPLMTHIKRSSPMDFVAFTAYLDHEIKGLNPGITIKCNRIITDKGHGYNTFTGIFTAPVSGVYYITYTFASNFKKTNLRLMKDGVNIVDAVTHPDPYSGTYTQTMSTNSAVLDVTAGQSLWLETIYDHDGDIFGLEDYRFVTFTGFLLAL